MDNKEPIDSGMELELHLTPWAKNFLLETAKWAKFLAIVGFIFLGLFVILAFSMGAIMSSFSELGGDEFDVFAGMGAGAITVSYLLIALLYFFPTLYLYRFATKTKMALQLSNSEELTDGLENLKSTFKFMGIMTIVVLAIYGLLLLIVLGTVGFAAL